MHILRDKLKSGATSIYVVVIATLLFGVITVSFIRIIINEASRTTNDELAQSAYDSALAGVEDAKVALKKYYECKLTGSESDESCTAVMAIGDAMNTTDSVITNTDGVITDVTVNCDVVARALSRNGIGAGGEVKIKETSMGDDTTVQAYTCVTLRDSLSDYRSTLGSGSTIRVIPLKTDEGAKNIKALKISWFSQQDGTSLNYGDTHTSGGFRHTDGGVYYAPLDTAPTPPTIAAQVIQTANQFKFYELDESRDGTTDRATVFLTPTDKDDINGINTISKSLLVDSNDHTKTKSPQKIKCSDDGASEFACSAILELPDPVNVDSEGRNPSTFFLVLSLPYGTPQTSFAVSLCKDVSCGTTANFSGVQVSIDSTGRANDMYSRVEARVEFNDISFPFPEYALQATANSGDGIKKNFYVTSDCYTLKNDGGEWHADKCDNTGSSD